MGSLLAFKLYMYCKCRKTLTQKPTLILTMLQLSATRCNPKPNLISAFAVGIHSAVQNKTEDYPRRAVK